MLPSCGEGHKGQSGGRPPREGRGPRRWPAVSVSRTRNKPGLSVQTLGKTSFPIELPLGPYGHFDARAVADKRQSGLFPGESAPGTAGQRSRQPGAHGGAADRSHPRPGRRRPVRAASPRRAGPKRKSRTRLQYLVIAEGDTPHRPGNLMGLGILIAVGTRAARSLLQPAHPEPLRSRGGFPESGAAGRPPLRGRPPPASRPPPVRTPPSGNHLDLT